MVVLGLDTATPATAVALLRDGTVVSARRHDPAAGERPGHAARLLGLVEEVLAGVGWSAVERVAVGVGPGGFTGLRIGVATARALAQARGIEAVGVSSLAALALPQLAPAVLPADAPPSTGPGPGAVLAVIDARRGEAFAAAFAADGTPVAEAAALRPEALATLAARLGPDPLAVGDGALAFRTVLEGAGARVPADDDPVHHVLGSSVCVLGAAAEPHGDPLPDYRREPDAVARRAP